MLDRITLFGSRGGRLQPSRNGEGSGAWLAVSPQRIGAVDRAAAIQAVRSQGGLVVTGSQAANSVEIQIHAEGAYQPPQKVLLIGDAGPSWVGLDAPIQLTPGDSLIVPEDRDAQDSAESLRALLLQLPEDRQGLIWSALSRPDAHFRLSRLEEEVRELRQAPPPSAAPIAPLEEKSATNWLLVGAAALLGLALGAGAMMLGSKNPAPAPEEPETVAVAPPADPLPVLTVADLERLDAAIAASPNKAAIVAVLGKDVSIAAGDDAGLLALAKLVMLKADVKDLAALTPEQIVEKLGELAPDLGPYPKLLAQYACDGALTTIVLPESFGACAAPPEVNDIRLNYFNLLDFVSKKPAP